MTRENTQNRRPAPPPLKGVIEKKSLGQDVFDYLKKAIVNGDIAPGNRLVESHIAQSLNISRTPVREAIHKLEREGFLKKLPRSGFAVQALTLKEIEETFGIRSVLESYAARLAAIHHRPGDLKALEKKIGQYQKVLDGGRLDLLPALNTEFHDMLYGLSRSPKLVKMISGLGEQIYRFRRIILKDTSLARTSNEDHRRMLELIRKKDADGVEKLVREHILRGQTAALAAMEKNRSV